MPAKKPTPSPVAEEEEFVLRYMATIADDAAWQLATLAATMAGVRREAGPAALVTRAIQIREAAAVALPAHRVALLHGADLNSLKALYYRMGGAKSDAEKKNDPHMMAIIEAMKVRSHETTETWDKDPARETEKAVIEADLVEVEAESGPRPALPYPLEKVIRWCTSAPTSLSWTVLEEAFIDFLGTLIAREITKGIFIRGLSDAAEWVERHEKAFADPDLPDESRRFHEKELVKYRKIVTEENAVAAYAESFTPGMLAPDTIAGTGAGTYAKHWKGKVVDEKNLHFFANEFRAFWKEHGPTYQAIHDAQMANDKELKKLKTAAGKAGAEVKARALWIGFTQNFVEWVGKREIDHALIDSHPKADGVVLHKGRAFLTTLLTAKTQPSVLADLEAALEAEGLKVKSSVAIECFSILTHRRIP